MSRKQENKTRTRLDGYLDILGLGLAMATLLGFLGRLYWVFDLFSHFRVQYMQLCLILIGIALWRRKNKRAVAWVLLACLNYAFVLPLYFGKPAPPSGPTVRAMLMNLNAGNGNTEQVLEAIKNADPDLLLLEEVTPKWAHELAVLNTAYPHRIAEPQEGCFGIMLLSKYPLEHSEIVQLDDSNVPTITTELHLPEGVVSVIGTHPVPPVNSRCFNDRNVHFSNLHKCAMTRNHPVFLIGDLNTSPWSPHFRDLLSQSGLKNSMKGFGFQPSWPSNNRFLRIPLDHMLHSPGIAIHNRVVGEDVGSDHFPVIVDFSIL